MDRNFTCPRGCGQTFYKSMSLKIHAHRCRGPAAKITGPLPPVPCLRCGEFFATAREMGQHQTLVHFGEASLVKSNLQHVRP